MKASSGSSSVGKSRTGALWSLLIAMLAQLLSHVHAATTLPFTDANWVSMGGLPGANGQVNAVVVDGSGNLYIGGRFSVIGDVLARNIAKWNGTNWSALGSGLSGGCSALAVSGIELFTGGEFTMAGGKISAYVARALLELPTLSALRSSVDVTLSWPAFYESFVLQENPNVANPNAWIDANYSLSTNGASKDVTVPVGATNQFFRLIGD